MSHPTAIVKSSDLREALSQLPPDKERKGAESRHRAYGRQLGSYGGCTRLHALPSMLAETGLVFLIALAGGLRTASALHVTLRFLELGWSSIFACTSIWF